MKIIRNIFRTAVSVFLVSGLSGCVEDNLVKPNALLSESSLTFEAIDAEPQLLTVASDDAWMIDAPEWITVDPMSGSQTVKVTVSVEDNVNKEGVMAAPREGTITIAANDGYSIKTIVYQKGDTYLGVEEYTVSRIISDTEEEDRVKVKDACVVALASSGFVVSDGASNIFVRSQEAVAIGDVLAISGIRSVMNGIPAVEGDVVSVVSEKEVSYPEADDISSSLDSFTAGSSTYITVSGTLVGSLLKKIEGEPATVVKVLDAHESVGLSEVNLHKLELTGYFAGKEAGTLYIVVTGYKDNGEDSSVAVDFPFADDFSWLDEYIAAANSFLEESKHISDCVGNVLTSADGAANIYTTLADNNVPVLEQLRLRGYTDLNPSFKTIYLQDAYFKFGATDKQSGLVLPYMKIDGEQDIVVSFRWCCHLSGALNVDDVKMVVAIEGPGTVVTSDNRPDAKVSDEIPSTQEKGEMFWMDASVKITGATMGTSITIRQEPTGTPENPVKGVHRFYLDDIQVVPASSMVEANIGISGIEDNLITFEGTPEAPVVFEVTSDRDFTISTSAKWLHLDVEGGAAGETRTVSLSCDPSDLPTLRRSSVIVKSGSSSHTIPVVQSAAGQELAPFISIVGGNERDVDGRECEFAVEVQANVPYKTEIMEGSEWLSVAPTTMAIVERSSVAFIAEANTEGVARIARVRFYNEEENIESVIVLTQNIFEDVVYEDDFSWVKPWADKYGSADSVGDQNASGKAPNVYTQETQAGFLDKYAELGYEDLNPDVTSFYTQKYYLKFGASNKHTGIRLPAIKDLEGATDVTLSFDWCAHMTGSGNIDKLKLLVWLEGPGTIVTEAGEASVSDPVASVQTKGQMFWQSLAFKLKGVAPETRIVIGPQDWDDNTITQKRWYIDNIKIVKD